MKTPSAVLMRQFFKDNPSFRRTEPQLHVWIRNQYADKLKEQQEEV